MMAFISLTFLTYIASFQSPRRNHIIEIDTSSRKKIKSTEDAWYFVHFKSIPDYSQLSAKGIEISTKNMISNQWYSLFLTPEQVSLLSDSAHLQVIESDEKILNSDLISKSNCLDIETSANFNPQDLPNHHEIIIKQIGQNLYRIKSKNNLKLSKQLSQNNKIFCISPSNQSQVANNRISGFTQFNTRDYTISNNNIVFDRPLEKKGLNGSETVVLIQDTFLDPKSTFFYDENFDHVETNTLYDNHRKIKYIFDSLDGSETMGTNEHGTHVAGTALGNSLDPESSIYNGIAPQAKVAFYTGGSDPHPVYDNVSKIIDDTKPCACSNSWGDIYHEPHVNNQWDLLSLKHNKTLFLFCAGNSNNFIWSPGSAKNVLTVGSIDSLPIDLHPEEDLTYIRKVFIYNNMKSIELPMKPWSAHDIDSIPGLKALFEQGIQEYRIATSNVPSYGYANRILFLKNKEMISNIDRDHLPNFLVLAEDITEDEFNSFSFEKQFPVVCVSEDVYNHILTLSPSYYIQLYANYASYSGIRKAAYSSDGPTTYGLMKPEIMAPGTVVFSASSDPNGENNHKDLCLISGTSMATPNVAGATALVAQYFQQGFYRKSSSIEPSSSLLKSVLINAADPVSDALFNTTYGFGVLNLHKYILLNNDNDDTGRVLIGDNIEIQDNSHLVAEIHVTNESELRVTMSYLDEPVHPDSLILLLIDLDLVVIAPNGAIYRGNQRSDEIEEHYSTNERVIIPQSDIQEGTYQIHIFSYLPKNIQKAYFAVSVFGSISYEHDQLVFEKATQCIDSFDSSDCNHSTTINDCTTSIYGHSCQIWSDLIIIEVPSGSKTVITVPPFGITYLSVLYPINWNFDEIAFDLIAVTEYPSVKISYTVNCVKNNKSCHVRESNADQVLLKQDLHLKIKNDGHNEDEYLLNAMIYNFASYSVDLLVLSSFTLPPDQSPTADYSDTVDYSETYTETSTIDDHDTHNGKSNSPVLISFLVIFAVGFFALAIILIVILVHNRREEYKTQEFKSINSDLI